MINLTKTQARIFILKKQGLIGDYQFSGKQGILDFVKQVGCLQFDPVDVCGRSADILLQSRVDDYSKSMLDELLYQDRLLIDFFDKNLAIIPIDDYPFFLTYYLAHNNNDYFKNADQIDIEELKPLVRELLTKKSSISSREIKTNKTLKGYWGIPTSLPRVTLELMYFQGELIIHHKIGTNKSYCLTKDYLPKNIFKKIVNISINDEDLEWLIQRRIGAVGLMWNKNSSVWLGLDIKAKQRDIIFQQLLKKNKILEIKVEGIDNVLYCLRTDHSLIDFVIKNPKIKPRCEFIAPLDSFIWDRLLIEKLFDFSYTWEIYTPANKRKYGYYVLPFLYGDLLIGRIEISCLYKKEIMSVKKIWWEDKIKPTKETKASVKKCIKRFALFNNCKTITYLN